MSSTPMLTGDALTVKRWEMNGWIQAMQQTALGRMFNRGAVHYSEEFLGREAKGDRVTYSFIGKMTGNPIGEGGTLDGNEKSLDLGSFNMTINETRDAILIPNSGIEPQRTLVNMENAAKKVLPVRCAELLDTSAFQQLAGVDPTSFTINGTTYATAAEKLHVQGHNTPAAPVASRILRAAAAATDQALTSADKLTLPLIDYALELNAVSEQPVEAFEDGTFDFYAHPYAITDLMHDTTSAIQWHPIEIARLEGGEDNYLNEGKWKNKVQVIGRYGPVNIISHPRVAQGANSSTSAVITTVRRNVLVGKNALAFGSPYGGRVTDTDVPLKIVDQLKDYKKYKGLGFELVYGLQKCKPTTASGNGLDVGVFVVGTYAAAHT